MKNVSQDDKILDELVKIREALAPTPKPKPEKKPKDKSIEGRMKGFTEEFKEFLSKYKVFGIFYLSGGFLFSVPLLIGSILLGLIFQ